MVLGGKWHQLKKGGKTYKEYSQREKERHYRLSMFLFNEREGSSNTGHARRNGGRKGIPLA